ncbi:hypothetical protein TPHA_0C00720 [Tetrapisispora phaffii CBS 4417]|uniref:Nuclear mRNA export factor n=1 Tax=Tetrapisispora phaffii (strain ATCC 24235 / CBS 4417 / NBRC 1672 / NRRL Y-8282 / UCD 70-5) TaxID=1071381 RepID=G8BR52_TETPH|nr:hypothetical protein TPHA_0C00720 [Tetrapisispora phaffii CBS 4417]CCE62228.1 hypothetical protein TPHA_0C00720 [Tetrapisispora phaffii CBS 4417]
MSSGFMNNLQDGRSTDFSKSGSQLKNKPMHKRKQSHESEFSKNNGNTQKKNGPKKLMMVQNDAVKDKVIGSIMSNPSNFGFQKRNYKRRELPRFLLGQNPQLKPRPFKQDPWDKLNQDKMTELENSIEDLTELYETLKKMRDNERKVMEKKGLVDKADFAKDLNDAIVFQGTCQDMCPIFERARRNVEYTVYSYEKDDPNSKKASVSKALKVFARPAAAAAPPLPSDVRPPHILVKTLDYLIDNLLPTLPASEGFIWDRMRSIRQDFTYQNYLGPEAIDCNERIVRIHLLIIHIMVKSGNEFSLQQELEQLHKSLITLSEIYDDVRNAGGACPNEAEFRAYGLLSKIRDPEYEKNIQELPDEIFKNELVQIALCFRKFISNSGFSERGFIRTESCLNFYTSYFQLMKSGNVPFLMNSFLEIYLNEVRFYAMKSLSHTLNKKSKPLSLDYIKENLSFNSNEEIISFCDYYSIDVVNDGIDLKTLSHHSHRIPESKPLKQSYLNFVDNQLQQQKYQHIINSGLPNIDSLPNVVSPLTVSVSENEFENDEEMELEDATMNQQVKSFTNSKPFFGKAEDKNEVISSAPKKNSLLEEKLKALRKQGGNKFNLPNLKQSNVVDKDEVKLEKIEEAKFSTSDIPIEAKFISETTPAISKPAIEFNLNSAFSGDSKKGPDESSTMMSSIFNNNIANETLTPRPAIKESIKKLDSLENKTEGSSLKANSFQGLFKKDVQPKGNRFNETKIEPSPISLHTKKSTTESELKKTQTIARKNLEDEKKSMIDSLSRKLYYAFIHEQCYLICNESKAEAHYINNKKKNYLNKWKRLLKNKQKEEEENKKRKEELLSVNKQLGVPIIRKVSLLSTPTTRNVSSSSFRIPSSTMKRTVLSPVNNEKSSFNHNNQKGNTNDIWEQFDIEQIYSNPIMKKCNKENIKSHSILLYSNNYSCVSTKWMLHKFGLFGDMNSRVIKGKDSSLTIKKVGLQEPPSSLEESQLLVFNTGVTAANIFDLELKLKQDGEDLVKLASKISISTNIKFSILIVYWESLETTFSENDITKFLKLPRISKSFESVLADIVVTRISNNFPEESLRRGLCEISSKYSFQYTEKGLQSSEKGLSARSIAGIASNGGSNTSLNSKNIDAKMKKMLEYEKQKYNSERSKNNTYAHLQIHLAASPKMRKRKLPILFSEVQNGKFRTPSAISIDAISSSPSVSSHLANKFRKTQQRIISAPDMVAPGTPSYINNLPRANLQLPLRLPSLEVTPVISRKVTPNSHILATTMISGDTSNGALNHSVTSSATRWNTSNVITATPVVQTSTMHVPVTHKRSTTPRHETFHGSIRTPSGGKTNSTRVSSLNNLRTLIDSVKKRAHD